MQSRVPTADVAEVALEVLDIDCVEANDGLQGEVSTTSLRDSVQERSGQTYRKKPDVGFSHLVAVVVRTGGVGEVLLRSVERLE